VVITFFITFDSPNNYLNCWLCV